MATAKNGYDNALQLRGTLQRLVQREIDEVGLRRRRATVTEINHDQTPPTCKVVTRPGSDPITARMGAVQPRTIGQVVLISGPNGDVWVSDVLGDSALTGQTSLQIGTVQNVTAVGQGPGLIASWDALPYTERYEVQVSSTSDFSFDVISVVTVSTQAIVQNLDVGTQYWVRVRGVSSSGSVGGWGPSQPSVVVPGFPAIGDSDGDPPDDSPTPVCKPAIGAITVEWLPTPNNDVVTYEVHASLTSGFTPGPTTKLGETTGTFWGIRRLPNDDVLPYGQNTFVRLIAKDEDGSATPGAQGFATPDTLSSNDFTGVANLSGSDGDIPAESPSSLAVQAGIGYLFLTWEAIDNDDYTTYEVHLGASSGFTPTTNTLVAETPGAFAFIRKLPVGLGGGAISYGTTYYLKVWARDADGYALSASASIAGTAIKASNADLNADSVATVQLQDAAIVSAKIADLAVGTGKIQDAAITTAKITNAAITNAKIANLAVGTAQIADAAIVTAKIGDAQITNAKIETLSADKINVGTLTGITIQGNTISGNTISGGTITGTAITGGTVTGATFRTAASGRRIQIFDSVDNHIYFYSGDGAELFPGFLNVGVGNNPYGQTSGRIQFYGPKVSNLSTASGAFLELYQSQASGRMSAVIGAHDLEINNCNHISTSTSDLKIGLGGLSGFLERIWIRTGQTWFSYSDYANVNMRLQNDGNMVIYQGGAAVWSAGVAISDSQMKRDVESVEPGHAMDVIRGIPFVTFEYKSDEWTMLPSGRRYGVIAQDVERVYEQGIQNIGGTRVVDQMSMLMLHHGAILDADTRLGQLESMVESLTENLPSLP